MTRSYLRILLLILLTLVFVPAAQADYYKYTDASGIVTISNTADSVPQKYRSRMKVIREETLSRKDPGARKAQQAAPAQEENTAPAEAAAPLAATAPQGKIAELSARYVWFTPLLYVIGLCVAFLLVIKIAALVPSPQLSKLIYLSFFLGVFVFLYRTYVTHVVEDSLAVKEKAINMMKKSVVREIPLSGEAPPAVK